MLNKSTILVIVLVALEIGSLVSVLAYTYYQVRPYSNWSEIGQRSQWMMSQWYPQSQPSNRRDTSLTLDDAKAIAQQYLASTQNPNLALKEIMEFQNNFYVMYYEKSTGLGAFEMLIWKQNLASGMMMGGAIGMGGGMMTSVIMPEPGPNMMWNTKYGVMNRGMTWQVMMGSWNQVSSLVTITKEKALEIGRSYLNRNLNGAKVEDAMQFYGYYTIDFTINGNIAGMLSVNAYTGQVWYHSWHGNFIQEVEFD